MLLPFRHSLTLSKIRPLALSLVVLAVAVLHAPLATAVETIPGDMREVMGLDCTPTCLLCHTVETGGAENLNEFGIQMGVDGVAFPNGGVADVFGPDGDASKSDFDEDGVSDTAEIIANTDPRSTADTGICSDATYGCGAQVAPGGTPFVSGWGLLAALGVAAALLRQLRA